VKSPVTVEVLWCSSASPMTPRCSRRPSGGHTRTRWAALPALSDDDPQSIYVIGHPADAASHTPFRRIGWRTEILGDGPQPSRVHPCRRRKVIAREAQPSIQSGRSSRCITPAARHIQLSGKGGTYPANEGIWIQSICRAARASAKDVRSLAERLAHYAPPRFYFAARERIS
jgi:hypothetical protein